MSQEIINVVLTSPTDEPLVEKIKAVSNRIRVANASGLHGAAMGEVVLELMLMFVKDAGAGLDVFTREPLPPENPFYAMPNVIFSPHISGDIPDYESRAADVFCENLRRYLAGEPFLHEVDRGKGY